MKLLSFTASALLANVALAENANNQTGEWHTPCDDYAKTITKVYTVYAPRETVCKTSTKTILSRYTVDGIVKITRTTSVVTKPTTLTITNTVRKSEVVSTTTRTFTRTSTVLAPKYWLPGKDTVKGWPEWRKRDAADGADVENEAEVEAAKDGKIDFSPQRKPSSEEHYSEYYPDEYYKHYKTYIVTRTKTVTPAPYINYVSTRTITQRTKYVPTTISATQSTTRTSIPISRITTQTTKVIPVTFTRDITTTTTYYAACAPNNIISHGPDGKAITNVYNNGYEYTSHYDVAPGTFKTPYDCCIACQKSKSCTGSVFRTGQNYCLLLHRKDNKCGAQCENPAVYVTDPFNRNAGLVVSNGRCGYQRFGGHQKPGVRQPVMGAKIQVPGLQISGEAA